MHVHTLEVDPHGKALARIGFTSGGHGPTPQRFRMARARQYQWQRRWGARTSAACLLPGPPKLPPSPAARSRDKSKDRLAMHLAFGSLAQAGAKVPEVSANATGEGRRLKLAG